MPNPNRVQHTDGGFWRLYAGTAILLSIVLGFGLGAGLFSWRADNRRAGLGWLISAQAHGHVQLYGWAGLMVLGVGLHFLPRLAHAQPVSRRAALVALALIFSGLIARTLSTILLATRSDAGAAHLLRWLVLGSITFELVGVLVALGALVRTLRPALKRQSAFASIAPLGLLAVISLIASLAIDVANAAGLVTSKRFLLDQTMTESSVFIAQYGFLLPIAVAMSARLFPLYLRTPPAEPRKLHLSAFLLAGGVVCGIGGLEFDRETLQALGSCVIAAAIAMAIVALGLISERRRLPRQSRHTLFEPIQWFVASAYFWLVMATVVSLFKALAQLDVISNPPPSAAQRHSFGAGFLTVLILGVGQTLLPGFAKGVSRSPAIVWTTLVLGNLATLLRVIPTLELASSEHGETMMSMAGAVGALALIFFAWNIGLVTGFRYRPKLPS